MTRFGLFLVAFGLVASACSSGQETAVPIQEAPESIAFSERSDGPPALSIVEPVDGAVVTSPFNVTVASENFRFEPEGEARDGAGHFHVLIDHGCVSSGELIPEDNSHIHAGEGESTIEMSLPAGTYQLCVQTGDGFDVALGVFETVTVVVEGGQVPTTSPVEVEPSGETDVPHAHVDGTGADGHSHE